MKELVKLQAQLTKQLKIINKIDGNIEQVIDEIQQLQQKLNCTLLEHAKLHNAVSTVCTRDPTQQLQNAKLRKLFDTESQKIYSNIAELQQKLKTQNEVLEELKKLKTGALVTQEEIELLCDECIAKYPQYKFSNTHFAHENVSKPVELKDPPLPLLENTTEQQSKPIPTPSPLPIPPAITYHTVSTLAEHKDQTTSKGQEIANQQAVITELKQKFTQKEQHEPLPINTKISPMPKAHSSSAKPLTTASTPARPSADSKTRIVPQTPNSLTRHQDLQKTNPSQIFLSMVNTQIKSKRAAFQDSDSNSDDDSDDSNWNLKIY